MPANDGVPGAPGALGAGDRGAEGKGAAGGKGAGGEGAAGEAKGEFVYSGNHLVVAAAMAEVAAGARFQRYVLHTHTHTHTHTQHTGLPWLRLPQGPAFKGRIVFFFFVFFFTPLFAFAAAKGEAGVRF